jgi:hypothetical protein
LAFYVNALFGSLGNSFADERFMLLGLRLPYILADIGSAILLYAIAKKYANAQVGAVIAGLFMLNPIFMLNSSMASQINSLMILTLLLALYCLLRRNVVGMLIFFGLSLLIDATAQYFVAPLIVYAVYLFVRAIRSTHRIRREGGSDLPLLKDPERNNIVLVPLTMVGVLLGMFLITLPLSIEGYGTNPWTFVNEMYLSRIDKLAYFGRNSLSLYNLFTRNGIPLGGNFPAMFFGVSFLLLSATIATVLFLSKRNRANMVLISSFVLLTLATYFVDFDAYALVVFLAVLLLSYVVVKDKRLLQVYGIYTVLLLINSMVARTAWLDTGNYLVEGGGMVVNIVLTVISLLAHIYFTIIVLDVCMTNRRLQLRADDTATFRESLKNWLGRTK